MSRITLFVGCLAVCLAQTVVASRGASPAPIVSQTQSSSSDKQQQGETSAQSDQTNKSDSDQGSDQSNVQGNDRNNDPSDSKHSDSRVAPTSTVKLRIDITNNLDKPVASASVYVRFNQAGGFLHHDHLAELDLKTNQDGTVKVPPIPQGKIMIQVIATGWHTYGKWYDINQPEDVIKIKLDPPPHWY